MSEPFNGKYTNSWSALLVVLGLSLATAIPSAQADVGPEQNPGRSHAKAEAESRPTRLNDASEQAELKRTDLPNGKTERSELTQPDLSSASEQTELRRSDLNQTRGSSDSGGEHRNDSDDGSEGRASSLRSETTSTSSGTSAGRAEQPEKPLPRSSDSSGTTDDGSDHYSGSAPGSSGAKQPFNLGIRRSVLDTGVSDQGSAATPLQSGTTKIERPNWPLGGNATNTQINSGTSSTMLRGDLTQDQLDRLARHDLVLIIDQSSSMHTADCPPPGFGRVGGAVMNILLGSMGSISRWQWCREQTTHLAEQTQGVSAKGLSVVLFSGNFAVFPHVGLNQIPTIFKAASPHGGTNLTDPLRETIADYFRRKKIARVKPLAIAIITDGLPNDERGVCQALVEATYYMQDQREIRVTFFLIGNNAYRGQVFVSELENNLNRYGARFNIVKSVSFWNLTKIGLARALADALQ